MKSVRVKTNSHGRGVYARRPFRKGEWILNFRGKIYHSRDNPRGLNAARNHFLQIGIDRFLGPSQTPDNFVNHSCDPNCGVRLQGEEVQLFALRSIKKGEEIRFDYSTTMVFDEWSMPCRCKSSKCRNIIEEFPRLSGETRRRYQSVGAVPRYVLLPAFFGRKFSPPKRVILTLIEILKMINF